MKAVVFHDIGDIRLEEVKEPKIKDPTGLAMNKNLTVQMGNCPHRKYIPMLVDLVQSGAIDPTQVLTKREPMMSAIEAYKAFDLRQPGWVKVELEPAKVTA